MKMFLYTVFDTVAVEAGPPFTAPNDGVAMRSYHRLLHDTPEHLRNEYELYRIGEFDTNDMGVCGITPQNLSNMIKMTEAEK